MSSSSSIIDFYSFNYLYCRKHSQHSLFVFEYCVLGQHKLWCVSVMKMVVVVMVMSTYLQTNPLHPHPFHPSALSCTSCCRGYQRLGLTAPLLTVPVAAASCTPGRTRSRPSFMASSAETAGGSGKPDTPDLPHHRCRASRSQSYSVFLQPKVGRLVNKRK